MSEREEVSEKVTEEELIGQEIIEYPRAVKNPFVPKKRTLLQKIFGTNKKKYEFNPEMKQPLLLLIKDDGYTEWIEGVKSGLFVITKKGTDEKRGIFLSPKKLTTINIPPFPKVWIAYEKEMSPYPLDVYHDSEELVGIIRKIEQNKNLLKDEAKLINAKMYFWLAIIGALGLILYFGFQRGWFNSLLGRG